MSQEKLSSVCDYGGDTGKYSWTQTKTDVSVSIPLHTTVNARQILCDLQKNTIKVGIKGEPVIIEGNLCEPIITGDSTWCLVDGKTIDISLQKKNEEWWKCVIVGDPEIDLDLIEGSKYLDDSLLRKIKEQKAKQKAEEVAKKTLQEENKTNC